MSDSTVPPDPHPAPLAPAAAPPLAAGPVGPPGPPVEPKRRRRTILFVVLGVILALLLLVAWVVMSFLNSLASFTSMPPESEVPVMRVDLASRVSLTGTIAPTQRLDLAFTSDGEVTSVPVNVGDAVTRGTALASIDDAELRAAVSDATAEANAARQDYNSARRTGPAAAVTAARSALTLKEQALKDARSALEKATLVSTIDGVVAAVNVKVGDRVGSGAPAGPGGDPGSPAGDTSAAVVVISRTFQVDASVGSADRPRVAKGMKATVTASSTRTPLPGTVTAVGVIAASSGGGGGERPSAATFPVTITLEGEPADIFAGAAASVELAGEGRAGVLAIPRGAVVDWSSGTEGTVLARRGGTGDPQPVPVTLGVSQDDLVEVVSGLAEGDVVLVVGGMGGPAMAGPGGFEGSGSRSAAPAEEKPR